MGTENGYIKSYRSIIEKPWYSKSEYFHLWHHLLYSATYKEMEVFFNNTVLKLKPGQLITGRKSLSKDTGINESKIERILNYFEKIEHQIEQQKTNKNRLITVLNWHKYQSCEQQNEQQTNNGRTTTEQQLNTNKNDKKDNNEKNEKNLEARETNFVSEVWQYGEQYPNTMLSKFINYWTEKNKSKTKMRYEGEPTFEVSKRLAYWASRDNEFNKGKSNPNDPDEFLKQLKEIEARNGNQK